MAKKKVATKKSTNSLKNSTGTVRKQTASPVASTEMLQAIPAHGRTEVPFQFQFPAHTDLKEDWLDFAYRMRRAHSSLCEVAANTSICVAGWAFRYRDQGGCVFVDLRDRTEIIQLMFDRSVIGDAFNEAEIIRSEFVLVVEGLLRKRTPENINPRLKNGSVEILVKKFKILNHSQTPPISLDEYQETHEDTRLKYRYLDMRRPEMRDALIARSRLNNALRAALESEGFLEVETPVLNKSTPEGARDFLVPARMSPGHFFALPQSPQLFKQILMVGGIEKYFQIVKCFRDEDLRADRQPEFTQLDLEMSFINEELLMETMERMLLRVMPAVFGIEWPETLPRLSYKEAMELYGKDAPDLRYDMKLVDIAEVASQSDFKVFKQIISEGGRVKALAVPGGARLSRKDIDELTAWVSQAYGAKGLAWMKHESNGLHSVVAKFFSKEQLVLISEMCKTNEGDIIFFGAGREDIVHATLANLREKLARDLNMIPEDAYAPVWITDFPLFEYDPGSGAIYSMHHPFTAPDPAQRDRLKDKDSFLKDKTPLRARAYDIVLNGSEIGGGSIRIHDPDVQADVFSILGISHEEAREKFGFFLDALAFGAPPHGGIAFGLDRILMLCLGRESIRDTIAFPKTQKGHCLLSESPSPVDVAQLRELRIALRPGT